MLRISTGSTVSLTEIPALDFRRKSVVAVGVLCKWVAGALCMRAAGEPCRKIANMLVEVVAQLALR